MRIHNFYMYIIIYYVSRYLLSSPILCFSRFPFIHTFSTQYDSSFAFLPLAIFYLAYKTNNYQKGWGGGRGYINEHERSFFAE